MKKAKETVLSKNMKLAVMAIIVFAIVGLFLRGPTQSGSSPLSMIEPRVIANGEISALEVDENTGKVYVSYFQTEDEVSNLFLISSDDNGKTFSEPVRVNAVEGDASPSGVSPPTIRTGPDGEVCLLWVHTEYTDEVAEQGFPWGLSSLRFACSNDEGETFGSTTRMPESKGVTSQIFSGFDIAPDGTIYAGWLKGYPFFRDRPEEGKPSPVVVARSLDGGNTFEMRGEANPISCPCCVVEVAMDDMGALLVSWRDIYDSPFDDNDYPDEHIPEYRDITIARSLDEGMTFSKTKVHDDNALTDQCVHSGAPMGLDSEGNVHIAWYTPKEDNPGIYYAVSPRGADDFSLPIKLQSANVFGASLVKLSIDSKDNAWAFWEDRASADNSMWMYNDVADVKLRAARITPEGDVAQSLVADKGKLPLIAAYDDSVHVVWNADGSVYFARLSEVSV